MPNFNCFHFYNYLYKIDDITNNKFSYIFQNEDIDLNFLPFETIFNSTELSVSGLIQLFNCRINQLKSIKIDDFINNGQNYPCILADMTYKDENNNFYNFWDIMREKCFDRLSYFQELCLHGLNLGDGCCAVNYEKTNLKEDKTVDLTEFYKDKLNESSIGYEYDSKSDDDDDNENTLKKVKYNIGFRYSQSIVHNLYFKFVSYIFCNQITSMALNVSNISINQEKSYLNNLFCINKPHIKPFRDIWYPKGVKIVDQSLKKYSMKLFLLFGFKMMVHLKNKHSMK